MSSDLHPALAHSSAAPSNRRASTTGPLISLPPTSGRALQLFWTPISRPCFTVVGPCLSWTLDTGHAASIDCHIVILHPRITCTPSTFVSTEYVHSTIETSWRTLYMRVQDTLILAEADLGFLHSTLSNHLSTGCLSVSVSDSHDSSTL